MAELTFFESYRTHGFYVEIEGTSVPVTKVTGLNEGMTETIKQVDGGDHIVRKISSGLVDHETITLERHMNGSPDDQYFQDWFSEMFQLNAPTAEGGIVNRTGGSSIRRNGAIVKLENGQEVLRFAFYEGWIKSSKFSDLEAASTNLFKQTVEIEHNGLERVV